MGVGLKTFRRHQFAKGRTPERLYPGTHCQSLGSSCPQTSPDLKSTKLSSKSNDNIVARIASSSSLLEYMSKIYR